MHEPLCVFRLYECYFSSLLRLIDRLPLLFPKVILPSGFAQYICDRQSHEILVGLDRKLEEVGLHLFLRITRTFGPPTILP